MIRVCRKNNLSVIKQVLSGKLDKIALSTTNLVDDIILAMSTHGILDCISENIPDIRSQNKAIPYSVIWASSIASKMKVHTSLTDIPCAICDYKTLAELGYTLFDKNGIKRSLMTEGALRFLIGKYNAETLICGYNNAVQNGIMKKMNLESNIHILDCTDIEVNYFNSNYEGAGIGYSKRHSSDMKEKGRGYKLSTLRGIVNDCGVIEEIRLGALNVHDLKLSEEMIRTTSVLKSGDILINDRGFLSRELVNYLKIEKGVDTYVPLRNGMQAYNIAIQIAKEECKWIQHPFKKYSTQKVCFVEDLGQYWRTDKYERSSLNYTYDDVYLNGCVIWETIDNTYSVIVTTDTKKSAQNILKVYCLRPEIEEDYRQLKDFWKLEDFKSTKLNLITFHIVSVLFGYLFFHLYTMFAEGEKYIGKSLPVVLKNYSPQVQGYIVLYVGEEFGVITLLELMEIYSAASKDIRHFISEKLDKI